MITARDVRPVMRVLSLVGGDDVATDKGDYNFVARWRGLWSWDCIVMQREGQTPPASNASIQAAPQTSGAPPTSPDESAR
jgi:hypothetical protein